MEKGSLVDMEIGNVLCGWLHSSCISKFKATDLVVWNSEVLIRNMKKDMNFLVYF